jgi:hypothetical protein
MRDVKHLKIRNALQFQKLLDTGSRPILWGLAGMTNYDTASCAGMKKPVFSHSIGLKNMWKITIALNAVIMILFFLASELAIALAYNHFIQYPETDGSIALPLVTEVVLDLRKAIIVVPIVWAVFSYFLYRVIGRKAVDDRNDYLLAFSLITIAVGLLMLLFFGLAGILPYHKIGVVVQ